MESRAKLNNILADALRVIRTPAGFYREMPKTGGLSDPIIFVLVMAVVMGLTVAVFSLIGAGVIGAIAAGIGAIITVPIFALIGSFISAAILFVVWKLMGSAEGYETAYRCVAYAAAIYPVMTVLGIIPYLGTIVGITWGIYLMITASMEVHQLDRKKAYTVFGVLGALLLVMNISSEMAARKMAVHAEKYGEQFEHLGKQFEGVNEMTPEEAGEALGGFIQGLNEAVRQVDESGQSTDEPVEVSPGEAAAALSTQGETASAKEITAEEAGKALGDFFSGLEKATREMREQAEGKAGDTPAAASASGEASEASPE